MTMNSIALLVGTVLIGAGQAPKVPVTTTDGKASGLSASRLLTLRASRMKHVVPAWVPEGFNVTRFHFEKEGAPAEWFWLAEYSNAKSKGKFTIQMGSDGFGDPILNDDKGNVVEPRLTTFYRSPVVGTGRFWTAKKGTWNAFATTWIDLRVKTLPSHVMLYGERVEPADARKILENLRWLR